MIEMSLNGQDDSELLKIRMKKIREMAGKLSTDKLSTEPVDVTDGEFSNFIEKHRLAIVDCWAAWCAPCRILSPIIDQLAKEYAGRIAFGKLNVDENPSTASKFSIMSIPTILVFHKGILVDKLIGVHPYQILKTRIEDYLNRFEGSQEKS
ncbi:MAG: thioredoxin [Thermoproteota archaeon]